MATEQSAIVQHIDFSVFQMPMHSNEENWRGKWMASFWPVPFDVDGDYDPPEDDLRFLECPFSSRDQAEAWVTQAKDALSAQRVSTWAQAEQLLTSLRPVTH